MLEITELSVVQPHEVAPGTLLLSGAHYDDPAVFVFEANAQSFWVEFGGSKPFQGYRMANNLHPYIAGGQPRLLIDIASKVSPSRSDIPAGTALLIGSDPFVAIRIDYGTAYVGLDGQLAEDPRSYERLVGFSRWRMVVPAFGQDQWMTVYESEAT
jgi:hypothetical protein